MKKPEDNSSMGIINPALEKERARMGSRLDMSGWIKTPADPQPGQCPNCGWTAADPDQQPNFCPECGNTFPKDMTLQKARWTAEGRCTVCGWMPPDRRELLAYCAECGMPFAQKNR